MTKRKIPRLNSTVYIVSMFGTCIDIEAVKVDFKNKEAFAIEVDSVIRLDSYKIHYFDDYGLDWFSTLKEAREFVESITHKTPKKIYDALDKDPFWRVDL